MNQWTGYVNEPTFLICSNCDCATLQADSDFTKMLKIQLKEGSEFLCSKCSKQEFGLGDNDDG